MIAINVSRVCAEAVKREKLTSGIQGVEVSFFFSADWDGLVKTAVFEGSGQSVDVLLTSASCEIPPEVLKKYGGMLRVGVYGVSSDGATVIPTVYADLGIIRRGADPQKDPTTNSSLPAWAQLQAQIGDLSNLTTEDKTNLVAAINEAAKSGGGSGGKGDPGKAATIQVGEVTTGAAGTPASVSNVGTDEAAIFDFTIPRGDRGAVGAAGADGITPHIGDNGNWYLGTTDTGKPSRGETGLQGSVGPVGPQGPQGEKGADGKTPVKGTDYWTAADKQEIIDDIHPVYYIDLTGEYPNYTCSVAMDDIKAAYNSGYNLACRCTLGACTATLPLFIPMPIANTWIFSGSGALTAMDFNAQSLTIAIVDGTVQASNTQLASLDDIPTALKNPNALTVKIGSTAVTYDGSSAQTVEIADGTEVEY